MSSAPTAGPPWSLPEEIRAAAAPLLEDPVHSAVVCDYDGTLAPIVADPAAAGPAHGTVAVLTDLSRCFGVVAVVSGRPLSFLLEQLDGAPQAVRMAGLYGLERRGPDGTEVEPRAARWTPVVQETVGRLRAAAPSGVVVEDKQLGVTVHWRRAPQAEEWVVAAARDEAARSGLRPQPGKMSVELRLPLAVDKGTALRDLVGESVAALYVGDDAGDLPAFHALADLARQRGMTGLSVAVVGAETPSEVVEGADLTVTGPDQAVALLRWLADGAPPADGASRAPD